jgi:hypothetical protein
VEALDRIDEIISAVEAARSVPMSSNCMINRSELLNSLETLRSELPNHIRYARQLLEEKEQIIAAGQREAERIIAEAHNERSQLIVSHEITEGARQEAARISAQAQADVQLLHSSAERHVDTALTNLENLLQRTLENVQLGRSRMSAVVGLTGGFPAESDEKPLPF